MQRPSGRVIVGLTKNQEKASVVKLRERGKCGKT